jgi:hypothetical protein
LKKVISYKTQVVAGCSFTEEPNFILPSKWINQSNPNWFCWFVQISVRYKSIILSNACPLKICIVSSIGILRTYYDVTSMVD